MSEYAKLDDVRSAAPQIRISAETRPSESEVQKILDAVEADLEIQLMNMGYELPIVGTGSVRIIRYMVCQEAISRILVTQVAGVRDPDDLGAGRAHAAYLERLKALSDPDDPFELPDATKLDTITKFDVVSSFPAVSERDGYRDAVMTRDKVF